MMEPTGENQNKSFKDKITSIFRREKSPQELLDQQVLKEAELIAGKKLSKDMYWEQLTPDQRARLEERRRTAESNFGMQPDSYPVQSNEEGQTEVKESKDKSSSPAPDLTRTYGNNTSVDLSGGAMTSEEKIDAALRQKYDPDDLEGLSKSLDMLMNQMWSDPNEELQKEIRYIKGLIKNHIPTVVDEPDFLRNISGFTDLDADVSEAPLAPAEVLSKYCTQPEWICDALEIVLDSKDGVLDPNCPEGMEYTNLEVACHFAREQYEDYLNRGVRYTLDDPSADKMASFSVYNSSLLRLVDLADEFLKMGVGQKGSASFKARFEDAKRAFFSSFAEINPSWGKDSGS